MSAKLPIRFRISGAITGDASSGSSRSRPVCERQEEDGRLQLRFDIVDTGVGLSKAVKDRLFQPCIEINSNLGDRPRASDRAQARRAHGRRHRLQERGWQGSLYWFTLPAQHLRPEPAKRVWAEAPAASESTAVIQEAPTASEPQATSKAPGPRQQPTLSGHVLVAEDNAVNRALIAPT